MGRIITRSLHCGMPLIVEEMHNVRSAAVSWLLPCGCAHDRADLEGLSTIQSELLMRGAGSLDSRQQADAFDRLGASRGTELGTLTMRISGTMLGSQVTQVLGLYADMVLRPLMDEAAMEPARDLALQSLESVQDEPQELVSVLLRNRHHPVPRNRSGLGTEDGLKKVTHQDVVGEWKRLAKPKGSVIAIAGAVDADACERELNRILDGWTGETADPVDAPPPNGGYWHEEDDTNQVQVLLAHDAPAEGHPDGVLEKFVATVLSGGMAGRLFTEVREKRGLCYSVNAGYRADRDYGVVSAYVGTTPERAQDSLDVLVSELRRINTPDGRITPDEFQRAKVGMKSGLVFSGESTGARAAALSSDYRRLGRARSLDELTAQIDAVTLDQLNAYLLRRQFGRVTIQTLGPKPLTPPM